MATTLTRRRWTTRLLALTALALGLVAAVAIIARATAPPPPLTAQRVAASLASEAGASREGFCTREGPGRWSCDVMTESGERLSAYDVTASSKSCWRATRATSRPDTPRTVAACLD